MQKQFSAYGHMFIDSLHFGLAQFNCQIGKKRDKKIAEIYLVINERTCQHAIEISSNPFFFFVHHHSSDVKKVLMDLRHIKRHFNT